MKVLVIGSGGREHAIVWKLSQDKKIDKIYAIPGNAGISLLAECIPIKVNDIEEITNFAKKNKIDWTIVG
ncbi:MAG: phosphoribosylamine--glycine ligase N-terminal domain-containing protein, partial [Dictyoglomaceae bacterium]